MAHSLSKREVDELRDAFALFDEDGDGQITKDELGKTMRSLGQAPSDRELQDMIDEVDADRSGSVDFKEFLIMMTKDRSETSVEQELREAFKVFDVDNTGTISRDELRQVMISLGERLSEADIDEMLKVADKDGDGTIDFDEFLALMTEGKG